MTQYYLNVKNKMNLSDYSKIYDYMSLVDKDDRFVVALNENSLQNTEIIYQMLKSNNFDVSYMGGEENEELRITAFRNQT